MTDSHEAFSYEEDFLTPEEAAELFRQCRTLPFTRRPNERDGGKSKILHQVVTFSDPCGLRRDDHGKARVDYVGAHFPLDQAPEAVKKLREKLSRRVGRDVNYFSVVLYEVGHDHMAYHQHREDKEPGRDMSVWIVSTGCGRKFGVKKLGASKKDAVKFIAKPGSLITLYSEANNTHQHSVIQDDRIKEARIAINCKVLPKAGTARPRVICCKGLGSPEIAAQKHPGAVYVGRRVTRGGNNWPDTPFGNYDHLSQDGFREYAELMMIDSQFAAKVEALRGKDLLCWCSGKETEHCHARVWLELANKPKKEVSDAAGAEATTTELHSSATTHNKTSVARARKTHARKPYEHTPSFLTKEEADESHDNAVKEFQTRQASEVSDGPEEPEAVADKARAKRKGPVYLEGVDYVPEFLSPAEADELLELMKSQPFADCRVSYGPQVFPPLRKSNAWKDLYALATNQQPEPEEIVLLRLRLSERYGVPFNSVQGNWHVGTSEVRAHCDPYRVVAMIRLGAMRIFEAGDQRRNGGGNFKPYPMPHGSLITFLSGGLAHRMFPDPGAGECVSLVFRLVTPPQTVASWHDKATYGKTRAAHRKLYDAAVSEYRSATAKNDKVLFGPEAKPIKEAQTEMERYAKSVAKNGKVYRCTPMSAEQALKHSGAKEHKSLSKAANDPVAHSSGPFKNAGIGSPTELLTFSAPECPNNTVASSLSDILEAGNLPQKYNLTAKCCAGVLHRAATRKRSGKLSPELEKALKKVVAEE